MSKLILTLLVALCCVTACQKKEDVPIDTSLVVTTITSPSEGAVYKSGDTVNIVADVAYPSQMHGYEVVISDTSTRAVLFNSDDHVHTDHFTINEQWIATALQLRSLKLRITTSIDHNGNKAIKERYFSIRP